MKANFYLILDDGTLSSIGGMLEAKNKSALLNKAKKQICAEQKPAGLYFIEENKGGLIRGGFVEYLKIGQMGE